MRLISLMLFFFVSLSACTRDDSRATGAAVGEAAGKIGQLVAPTGTAAVEGFAQAVVNRPLYEMQECQRRRQGPRFETVTVDVAGRSAKECVAEQGGVINEEVMKCRNGFKRQERREVPYVPDQSVGCR